MRIKLTTKQMEAVLHRLWETDCLADALADTHPDDPPSPWTREQVEDVNDALLAGVGKRHIDCTAADALNHDLTGAVLRDCLEGSTYAACASQEAPQVQDGAYRSLSNAAREIARQRCWADVPQVPYH